MGLFGSNSCSICKEKMVSKDTGIRLKNGCICEHCLKPYGLYLDRSKKFTLKQVNEFKEYRNENKCIMTQTFRPTQVTGEDIKVYTDFQHELFCITSLKEGKDQVIVCQEFNEEKDLYKQAIMIPETELFYFNQLQSVSKTLIQDMGQDRYKINIVIRNHKWIQSIFLPVNGDEILARQIEGSFKDILRHEKLKGKQYKRQGVPS